MRVVRQLVREFSRFQLDCHFDRAAFYVNTLGYLSTQWTVSDIRYFAEILSIPMPSTLRVDSSQIYSDSCPHMIGCYISVSSRNGFDQMTIVSVWLVRCAFYHEHNFVIHPDILLLPMERKIQLKGTSEWVFAYPTAFNCKDELHKITFSLSSMINR